MARDTDTGPKRVGIWVRVSTDDQARGESPEHHERRARAFCEARDWRVAEFYSLEAVSGKSVMAHPEAKRMLADIRSGHITGLVFSKLARLARNTKELLEFSEIFRACGADLVSLQESIDTSSPAGRLFFTMIAAMAQWEREEISDRVQASVPIRAKLGKQTGGAAPFGYQWLDKHLVPHPEEAPVRALIYELYAEHRRKKRVARILNERGYRTRSGELFSDTTVSRLIADPTAKGLHRANYTTTSDHTKAWTLKPESEWVYREVPAIVSEELWDKCNRIVEEQATRPPTRRTTHLFAGYAYCACGQKMYVWSQSPKYICSACRNKIPVADLEVVYRDQLRHFVVSPEEIRAHSDAANEAITEKEKLIEAGEIELRRNAAEAERLYQLYLADKLSMDDFGRRNDPLTERRRQLEHELPRLEAERDVLRISLLSRSEALEEARDLSNRWSDLPFEDRRQIVEAITDRIVIGKDDIEISLLHLPSGSDGGKATRSHSRVAFLLDGVTAVLRSPKPEVAALYGESLGKQLKRRRRELGLRRSDAAAQMGICERTLSGWEEEERPPFAHMYPAIIAFLGYEPWPTPVTLAEALRAERLRRGLSVKVAAPLIGVDEGTWLRWERGEWRPTRLTAPALDSFLGANTREVYGAWMRQRG